MAKFRYEGNKSVADSTAVLSLFSGEKVHLGDVGDFSPADHQAFFPLAVLTAVDEAKAAPAVVVPVADPAPVNDTSKKEVR